MDILVPKWFRSLVINTYPALSHKSYLRLMCRLMFSGRQCEDAGDVLIPYHSLASDAGEVKRGQSNNFEAVKFLKDFKRDVFHDTGFEWSTYYSVEGRCRSCKAKFAAEVEKALVDLDKWDWLDDDLVYFVSGRKASRQERSDLLKGMRGSSRVAECPEAREILEYLNSTPANAFASITDRAKEMLQGWKENLFAQGLSDQSRRSQSRTLLALTSCPVPVYQPSSKGNTARLFGANEGLLNLKKAIRKQLCEEWYEADLSNSQLAIVGKLWGVPEVNDFLAKGQPLWNDLLPFLGVYEDNPNWDEVKAACKIALYSLIFGMGMRGVRKHLRDELSSLGVKNPLHFLNHPVIAALAKRRDAILQDLLDKGEAFTCFGKRIKVKNEEDARSALAQQAQAMELLIIHAAYDLAKTTNEFRIVLHQHDGFSVKFLRRAESWKRRIDEAVNHRAKNLGVMTSLVWDKLEPAAVIEIESEKTSLAA